MEKMIETRQEVLEFLRVDEFQNGDGSGYGYGYGDGSGYGYGYGDGSGYGYGYGDGRDVEVLNGMVVHRIDGVPTIIDSVHHRYAKGRILNSDLTTKPCFIARWGNYFAHGDTLEEAVKDARAKYEKNLPTEELIRLFNQQYPDRDEKVPASELFQWHNKLTGSCLAGRKHFCVEHGLDYEHGEYTVNEFIELTKDAYGGDVIRQLNESRPQ